MGTERASAVVGCGGRGQAARGVTRPDAPTTSAGTSDTAACGPGRACAGTLTRPWDRGGSLLRPVGAAAHGRRRAATAVARLTTPRAG